MNKLLNRFYIIILSKNISIIKIKLIFAKILLMKKLLFLFSLVFIFNSCDDGDITLESFNFSNAQILKCSDASKPFLYKINYNELLLLNLPSEAYANEVTAANEPRTYPITGSVSVLYRLYSDTVPTTFICNSIAPATPVVTNEWNATGGTIEVTTIERFDTDEITLLGYTHAIRLKTINFSNESNSFSFEEYFFGNYQTTL